MHASLPFRAPRFAVVPLLALLLLGQDCETCPPPDNPCQQAIQIISGGTRECGVRDRPEDSVCDNGGVTGICTNGECVTSECAGAPPFSLCDSPLGGGLVGVCIDELCVRSGEEDRCVKFGIGRINCCSPQGCRVANGAYCNDPLDGVSCDPTGVEPVNQPGQTGQCIAGTCVAQTGLCAGEFCATTEDRVCVRNFCDQSTGECAGWSPDSFPTCVAGGGAQGFCQLGVCRAIPGGECNGAPCVAPTSCQSAACRLTCLPDCTLEELQDPTYRCEINNRSNGAPCDGEPGMCMNGVCEPGDCLNNQQCDDLNPCTTNRCVDGVCDPSGSQPVSDGITCAESEAGEILGICDNGVCLPNLCIGRDCSDGNSCTQDVCTPPFGVCSNPNEANGTRCENAGRCQGGICLPAALECAKDASCDDGNSCTRDTCPAGACIFTTLPNGEPCIGENGTCFFGSCQFFQL